MSISHVVRSGDCIESIAYAHGFFPDTLWLHPENAALREKRDNPHVLAPGDVLFIPDRREKSVEAATGRRHQFRRRGVPAKFRVVLERKGEPRAGVAYVLEAHTVIEGVTGADGAVEHWIPPGLDRVTLRIGETECYEFRLGHLLPISEEEGVRVRLSNLGYPLPEASSEVPERIEERRRKAVIRRFQTDQGIPATGHMDDQTRRTLLDAHGS